MFTSTNIVQRLIDKNEKDIENILVSEIIKSKFSKSFFWMSSNFNGLKNYCSKPNSEIMNEFLFSK